MGYGVDFYQIVKSEIEEKFPFWRQIDHSISLKIVDPLRGEQKREKKDQGESPPSRRW